MALTGRACRLVGPIAATALLLACSVAPMNEPIATARTADPAPGTVYDFRHLEQHGSDETLVALAFSGGGKRSAAFAYGALTGFRNMPVTIDAKTENILNEIDVISSVSGGSFPAVYYALNRESTFDNFEKDFLKRDIETYIYGMYLLPWHWEWMVNPLWGTNDTMMQVYDNLMFHGATYADLIDKGRPLVTVGATDVGLGNVFVFTQQQFDLICSNLATFPLARAVAASNGFPVLFTPITLENHRQDCPEGLPKWLPPRSTASDDTKTRAEYVLDSYHRYLDPEVEYVHLMDGGIADNLALRGLLNALMLFSNPDWFRDSDAWVKTRRILVLSIDGEAASNKGWTDQRIVTGLSQVFSAVSGAQIDRYNFETLLLARQTVADFTDVLKQRRCAVAPEIDGHPCDDVQGFFGHIALADITDAAVRERLEVIPTGLTVADEDVDLLVEAGRSSVQNSTVLHRFVDSLNAPSAAGETASAASAPARGTKTIEGPSTGAVPRLPTSRFPPAPDHAKSQQSGSAGLAQR